MPLCGHQVLTVAPISVLDRKGNVDKKVDRRLRESVKEAGIDFQGVTGMLSKSDAVSFLKENSQKMEKNMSQVITQLHGTSPSSQPQPQPSLTNYAKPRPSGV